MINYDYIHPSFYYLLINKINNLIGFCIIVYRYQNSFVVIELLKWPVHPITATRTVFITKTYYEHAIIPWPKYHPWGSYSRFENVFQKVRTLDLLVAAFLAIVSVVVPFISFLSDNFGGRCCKKRSPYLYAHTFYVLLYSKVEHLPLCLSAVYAVFFFRPLSKAKIHICCFSPHFSLTFGTFCIFHAFFVRFC